MVTRNYEKMKAHFDCFQDLEREVGSLKNAQKLREMLKQNSFQLGLQNYMNKERELETKFYMQNS